jgi:arylsulfatase A-like enzyme
VSDFPEYGGQQSVIDGKWKLIRKGLTKAGPEHPTPWELYDLQADIEETIDLAADHPEEVRRLSAIFEASYISNAEFPMYPATKKY